MKVVFTKAKLEGWALVAEIGGALAVIVSVIYLGKQINDNTKLLRSQAGPKAAGNDGREREFGRRGNRMRRQPGGSRSHDLAALRQLLLHAVQFLGVHVLSEPGQLNPATTVGRSRCLLQDAGADKARLRALLE